MTMLPLRSRLKFFTVYGMSMTVLTTKHLRSLVKKLFLDLFEIKDKDKDKVSGVTGYSYDIRSSE